MTEFIKFITEIVNIWHDVLLKLFKSLGFNLSDKDLHFWVIGVIGIFSFLFVQITFKWISKWSITAISFVYTFTVLIVIVFAIEIQQKITGRGKMEFDDAVVGLYGFLFLFGIYLVIRLMVYLALLIYKKYIK
jgi:hypothetical protein